MNTNNDQTPQLPQDSVSGSTLISDCDLSIRTKKLFDITGFTYVSDILQYDYLYLMRFRGFGKASLKEVIHFMRINNLHFEN
jgi:DNA-directed RNA polymerase alpha subunit